MQDEVQEVTVDASPIRPESVVQELAQTVEPSRTVEASEAVEPSPPAESAPNVEQPADPVILTEENTVPTTESSEPAPKHSENTPEVSESLNITEAEAVQDSQVTEPPTENTPAELSDPPQQVDTSIEAGEARLEEALAREQSAKSSTKPNSASTHHSAADVQEVKELEDTTALLFEAQAARVDSATERAAALAAAAREREDRGWLSDLDTDIITRKKAQTDTYTHACLELEIVPASYFAARLQEPKLVMKYHGVGPKGARAIAQVLEYNKHIQHLDLESNCCGSGGFYIASALRTNSTLVHLDLSRNALGIYAGKEFSEMLSENSTLKTLILKHNEAFHLATGLRSNSNLVTLDLSYNEIGDLGASELGAGIAVNSGLKELVLEYNHIRPRGISAFFNNLKDNLTISGIWIGSNGIGDAGQAIAAFLQRCNSIHVLSMSRTRLSDAGITAVSKGIEGSTSLRELICSNNSFSDASIAIFFKALTGCPTLRKVRMEGIFLGKEGRARLDDLRAQKPTFEIIE